MRQEEEEADIKVSAERGECLSCLCKKQLPEGEELDTVTSRQRNGGLVHARRSVWERVGQRSGLRVKRGWGIYLLLVRRTVQYY